MQIIITIIAMLGMITLHEWGHYIAGRICKIPIFEFSIGMGPQIYQKKNKKGTKITLRALPIGGYCAFDDAENSSYADSALNRIPISQKIFICLMGPLVNILTAVVIFFCLALFIGKTVPTQTLLEVLEGYPAYGILQEDDYIVEINDIAVDKDNSITSLINSNTPNEVKIEFLRDNEAKTAYIKPMEKDGSYYIGIKYGNAYEKVSFGEAIELTFKNTYNSVISVYKGLFSLITGKVALKDMSGVVGIVAYMSEYATLATIYSFMSMIAIISVNLGIMNLLPIPALDGSKILFGIIEICRGGKRIPEKIEEKLINVGYCILMGMMVFVIISDIIKLF